MNKVKIELEYLHGPIWCYSEDDISYIDHFDVIKNDKYCQQLNDDIMNLYSSYYEFSNDAVHCSFNYNKQFEERFIVKDLLKKLVNRLNEINDGSYEIEPIALEWYEELCLKNNFKDFDI